MHASSRTVRRPRLPRLKRATLLAGFALVAGTVQAREPQRPATPSTTKTRVAAEPARTPTRKASVCDTLLPLRVRFRFGTGSRPAAPPMLGKDGELYVGTADGLVHALRADGSYRWSYTLRSGVTGQGVVDSFGQVLVPTARSIYALRADGTLAWVFNNPVELLGDLVRDGAGQVRFASADGRLFEFDERGALIRNVRASRPWSAPLVVLPDGSVAGGSASGLVLVSKRTNTSRFELENPVEQVLSCPGNRLCAISGGELRVLSGEPAGARTPARRAASRGEWLAVLRDERTLALYRGAGATSVFEAVLPDAASAAPAVDARGRVYVPLMGGALLVFTAAGKPAGCEQIGRSQLATPVLTADGTVLIAAREGLIAAVSAE